MKKQSMRVDSKSPKQMGVDEDWFGFVPSIPVMISCVSKDGRPNIIPVMSWSFACRWPPIMTVGICEVDYTPRYFRRASYQMILDTGEFVVNFLDQSLREVMLQTGGISANDDSIDKFAATGLTATPSLVVRSPLIGECPINLECVVTDHTSLGSHHLFCGEVVAYHQPGEVVSSDSAGGLERITYELADSGERIELEWSGLMRLERSGTLSTG
ncbi:MAG: flavin reductase family protein [Anaerolineae bacterium]|nr:flavin reductase family protein [Anaerolineae bacterium]